MKNAQDYIELLKETKNRNLRSTADFLCYMYKIEVEYTKSWKVDKIRNWLIGKLEGIQE